MRSGRSSRSGAAAPFSGEPVPSGQKGRRHVRTRRVDYVIALLITAVGAWVAWTSVQLIRAEAHSMQARYRIDSWVSGKARWQLPQWLEARDGLRAALAITPTNATLHDYLAALHMLRGQQAWANESLRQAFYGEARDHLLQAVALRPPHASGWASLAQAEFALEPCSARQWDAWRKALHFGPYEQSVQVALADLSIACTGRDPEDVQAWLQAHYTRSHKWDRKRLEDAARRRGFADRFKAAAFESASR